MPVVRNVNSKQTHGPMEDVSKFQDSLTPSVSGVGKRIDAAVQL